MYAAGSEEEKRAGRRLHGGTIAQVFVFCKRGVAGVPDSGVRPLMGTGVLSWRAPSIRGWPGLACAVVPPAHPPTFLGTGGLALYPRRGLRPCTPLGATGVRWGLRHPSAEGLAWRASLSHRPTLQRSWEQGDSPCTPGGGCAPCTLLGDGGSLGPAPSFSGGSGLACAVVPPAHPPTLLGTGGLPLYPRRGLRPPHPAGGRGFVGACAILQRRVWLGVRRCPTGPPSNVFGNRGTPPVPPAGAAPPAPCWGREGGVVCSPWRVERLPRLPPSTGAGTEQPPAPRLGDGGGVVCDLAGRFLACPRVRRKEERLAP